MKAVGPTKETGTTISFKPDAEVFEETEWDTEWLASASARPRS
jgi:DNA gyrase/topoisomerase IV subunit B